MSNFIYCYAECRYAECRNAEYRYAKCRYAECRDATTLIDVIPLKQRVTKWSIHMESYLQHFIFF
jgi:hypothetical protein